MLHNFGRVHSLPHIPGVVINYQINFIADKPARSLITITLVADDIKIIVRKSPARIVEAYIESFESLAEAGQLVAIVQNIGSYSAMYNVSKSTHCMLTD